MTLLLKDLLVRLLPSFPLCDLTSPRKALVSPTVLLMAPFLMRLITMDRSVRETEYLRLLYMSCLTAHGLVLEILVRTAVLLL